MSLTQVGALELRSWRFTIDHTRRLGHGERRAPVAE
jgi:hypothetical protein